MRCITRDGAWIVLAEWYGVERVVYGPTDVLDAARWMRDNA
jgi:hypothetical protein